jgi:hypothetical protein
MNDKTMSSQCQVCTTTYQLGLWVVAFGAEHEALDEAVEQVLKLGRLVGTVHDVAIILRVKLGLRTKLTTKVLGGVCNISHQSLYTQCTSYDAPMQ